MSVICNPKIESGVVSTFTPAGATEQSVSRNQYDRTGGTLTSTTTPAISVESTAELTPGNGTVNLDLTACADIIGGTTTTFSGKKVVYAQFKCPSTNAAVVKVKTGASNGYDLQGGQQIWVYPGATVGHYFAGNLTAVDGTHKVLDITGTVALDKIDYQLVGG